jgi:hypothetical protein
MSSIDVQQALYHRDDDQPPVLVARSPAFADAWLIETERLIVGFGARPVGIPCPLAVFALPLTSAKVAIVRVAVQANRADSLLAFHVLVMERSAYERHAGDPFVLARMLPTAWEDRGELPALSWPAEPPTPRTVADVQAVLRRVKASALGEDEDPESPTFERTPENSESPALLGGVQILVDGGKLVFVRPKGDLPLVEGLWTLLPYSTRCKIWPASFAFSNDLGFDVIVVPRLNLGDFEGYTSEEQAALSPAGSYELALQTAAESGDQRDLETVFRRRNSNEILRLAMYLIIGMSILVIGLRWWPAGAPAVSERNQKLCTGAGIVAVADPLTAAVMLEYGQRLWPKTQASRAP